MRQITLKVRAPETAPAAAQSRANSVESDAERTMTKARTHTPAIAPISNESANSNGSGNVLNAG